MRTPLLRIAIGMERGRGEALFFNLCVKITHRFFVFKFMYLSLCCNNAKIWITKKHFVTNIPDLR